MYPDPISLIAQNSTLGLNDLQFKKQRQAYLAQRYARKRQAQMQVKKGFDRSSSSESDGLPSNKQPVLIKENYNIEGSNTDSSKNSPLPQTYFRAEREKYKMQRLVRRQQALVNKRKQFGSSSSSDQEIPIHPRAKIVPEINVEILSLPYKAEDSACFGVNSLEVNLAKQDRQPQSAQLGTVRLKDKKQMRQRYQVEAPSNKGMNIWTQQWLELRQNSMELGLKNIPIYDITKIKMIIQPTQAGNYKIKLTVKEENVYLAVKQKMNDTYFLDQLYFIFAKIIMLKLQLMGRKTVEARHVKTGISEKVLKQARLTGKVRKNSFFGGWEEKIGVVTNNGLAIYKQGKDKAVLMIARGSVKEIWTRFQFEKENIILKFLNGSSKIELSVPFQNFLSRDNWLYQIYTLTPK